MLQLNSLRLEERQVQRGQPKELDPLFRRRSQGRVMASGAECVRRRPAHGAIPLLLVTGMTLECHFAVRIVAEGVRPVIERDPSSPHRRPISELRMSLLETGELEFMAGLAARVADRAQVVRASLMFAMADGTSEPTFFRWRYHALDRLAPQLRAKTADIFLEDVRGHAMGEQRGRRGHAFIMAAKAKAGLWLIRRRAKPREQGTLRASMAGLASFASFFRMGEGLCMLAREGAGHKELIAPR